VDDVGAKAQVTPHVDLVHDHDGGRISIWIRVIGSISPDITLCAISAVR
jgi:hypothetical protein